jgi:hypothetical protein
MKGPTDPLHQNILANSAAGKQSPVFFQGEVGRITKDLGCFKTGLVKTPVLKAMQGVMMNKIFQGRLRWKVVPDMFKGVFY